MRYMIIPLIDSILEYLIIYGMKFGVFVATAAAVVTGLPGDPETPKEEDPKLKCYREVRT